MTKDHISHMFEYFDNLKSQMDWRAAFGDPHTEGDRTIIPVASVTSGVGLGWGAASQEDETTEEPELELPGGGGGGSGIVSRPVAIIEITPEKTSVRPIIDYARLILAGMLTIAWIAFLWSGVAKKFFQMRETMRQ